MLSRVAAVKAPRTDNRRRVTGSSGGRREGRESEPQRPHIFRDVFAFAVLLLLIVMMCCGTYGAAAAGGNNGKSDLRNIYKLQGVDLFVSRKTLVLPKEGNNSGTPRDSFVSPSLVSAGGVIAAFAEGHVKAKNTADAQSITHFYSDVVAGYIDSAWNWTTLVDNINKSTWGAHIVLTAADGQKRLNVMLNPTTIAKGDKVFLLSEGSLWFNLSENNFWDRFDLKLVVGTVTNSTRGMPSKRISWDNPKSLSVLNTSAASYESKFERVFPSGGSGVLMDNGALVFPVIAFDEKDDVFSMIIYSMDDGANWTLSNGTSPAKCETPRVTEWEGSLLMIVDCENDQSVFESRDMGTTWTAALGTLPGAWTKSKSKAILDRSFYVEALITATIGGRRVMLYTQRGEFSGNETERALYLWVKDNIRSFCVGPVAMKDGMNWLFTSSLLYSDGNLHLLQQRENDKGSAISLSRLTEELSAIKSVLSTWAQKDAFFSKLTIPTAGLVAVLSNALSGGDTWIDEYLCLNATVTNATKVRYGFQLTEPSSRVSWSVNTRANNVRHVSLSHNFTLVASVTIEETPSGNTPLLTATLADTASNHTMGLSYAANKTWGTGLKGKKTTQNGSWEPKKGYQVALMLQGKKASVYIDGKLLGQEEVPLTGEAPLELVRFCFGACGEDAGQKPKVTVKNVFLYNRPLNSTEMAAIKDRAHTSNGPGEALAGWAALEGAAAREHAAVVGLTSAGIALLPLLLLLGLWGFASA
ncbi:putative trans-sialidase, Group II [Trypanosoma cruzi]|uniref:Trans-sialidase, putative n=3 Tax=Trypanosoma cruzi TaxID=5693 RepID=Q4CVH9_TRYCC|nr:trans-sialidase, putative [Trypanosoma cruzi]EAN84281.1 trans-sialidase, putative [Trypanosoma cruzi]PWU88855.1 putative trans-sialidase, Group II [Trypanosoma cruzi]RNC35941.1 trans-sialidase-like protein [Trypanosoma cruzi]|eukprot:XP_806132.1 trans-sialidase [Trypanosoma cruzi strain CL Brener]